MLDVVLLAISMLCAAFFGAIMVMALWRNGWRAAWVAILTGCIAFTFVGMSVATLSQLVGPQVQTRLGVVALIGAVIGYVTVAAMWWRHHPDHAQATFFWLFALILSGSGERAYSSHALPLISMLSFFFLSSALCTGMVVAIWIIFRSRRYPSAR